MAATDAPYRLGEIRAAFAESPFKERLPEAAQAAVAAAQELVRANLEDVLRPHCPTCQCAPTVTGWSIAMCRRFLAIPIERVHKASGGH